MKRKPLIEIPVGVKIGSERKKYQRWSLAEILISASGGLMSVDEANLQAKTIAKKRDKKLT